MHKVLGVDAYFIHVHTLHPTNPFSPYITLHLYTCTWFDFGLFLFGIKPGAFMTVVAYTLMLHFQIGYSEQRQEGG